MKYIPHSTLAALLLSFSAGGFAQDTSTAAIPVPTPVPDVTVTAEPAVDPASLEYSNKWRIKFDNRTDSAGEIILMFAMKDAQPVSISVSVAEGLGENDIAKLVENALKKNAPKGIQVERDDGEDVLVKFKNRFSLTLARNTVTDLDIDLVKE